jgi:hypothetical protein
MPAKQPSPLTGKQKERIYNFCQKGWTSYRIADKVKCTIGQVAAIKAHITMGHSLIL